MTAKLPRNKVLKHPSEATQGTVVRHYLEYRSEVGMNKNSQVNNLRLVCPNCNSQLSTSAGRNIGRVKNIAADGQGYEIHSDEGVQRKYWATLTSSVKVGGKADTEIVQGSDQFKTD